jgi:hypothetical protein
MFASVLDEFQYNKELIFDYLILNKDITSWTPPEKGIYQVKNNFVEEKLASVELLCDVGSQKATILMEVTHYDPCVEVRHYSKDAFYENGEPVRRGYFFPFDHMAFRTIFRESSKGCQVLQEVYIKPRGPIGWVICKLLILPQVKAELKNSVVSLKKYLQKGGVKI